MLKKSCWTKAFAIFISAVLMLSTVTTAIAAQGSGSQQDVYIANVALGKAASANCYQNEERAPSRAVDGNISTMWVANNGNPGNWWMVDLGQVTNLLGGEIVFEKEGDVWQYIVEGSTDGISWETLVDNSGSSSGDRLQVLDFTTSTRYVRVTVTGVPASRWTAVCEVRLWGEDTFEITGSNVALNKNATAISEEDANRAASKAVDGDLSTLWIARGGDAGNWIKVDLGDRYSINALRLTFENADRVWKYKVQVSANDSDWITVIDKSAGNFARKSQAYPLTPIPVRYVRVVFDSAPGSAWTALGELEVFGVEAPPVGEPEKLLVLVPHEDDEALIAAGIIHNAILKGDTVKVAIVTNGDCNGWDQSLGVRRINESIAAMEVLGLSRENITVFGYSDTGGFEPWTRYTDSFLYKLYHAASDTQVLSSNFGNTQTYGASGVLDDYHYQKTGEHGSYTRQNFVWDLTSYIEEYMPDRIYTTSAYDRHGDHGYLNVFATDIVRGIVDRNPSYAPVMYEMIVHSTDGDVLWPILDTDPTPLQNYTAPANMDEIPLRWEDRISVPMPLDMQTIPRSGNMKNVCLATYASQYSSWIGSFTKADEFFWAKDFSNLAFRATVTASSSTEKDPAAHVADGMVGGYLQLPDRNWVAENEAAGAWVQLDWAEGQNITKIVLHDIPGGDINVTEGVLTFSDGSSISVSQLPADGKPLAIPVSKEGITWIRFTIDNVSGTNAGLSELEVF